MENDNASRRRPQVGDIAIHNQNNVLLYVGVVESICSHDSNICKGSAMVTGMDNQFYECAKLHYWHADRADTIFVARPTVVPEPMQIIPAVPDKALAEEHVDASMPHSDIWPCEHCAALDPDYVKKGPPSAPVGVLGSNPDEEPF